MFVERTATRRRWGSSWSGGTPRRLSTSARSSALRGGRDRGPARRDRGRRGRFAASARRGAAVVARRHRLEAFRAIHTDDPFVAGIIVQMPLPPDVRLRDDHRRDRPGQGHRRDPPAQCRAPAPRLRGLPAGHRARGDRDAPPLRHPDRGPARPSSSAARTSSACRRRSCSSASTPRSPSATRGRATSPPTSRRADILVVAAGRPGLITGSMLRPGAIVVDVGINVVDDAIVGDVDFASARSVAAAITPVPGGVGPVTNALLLTHLVRAAVRQADRRQAEESTRMSFPSDLEIARSVDAPPDRRRGRATSGLTEDDIELYGPLKAKVKPPGDRAARGRQPARQVHPRHGDHPDAARRGQDHDHRRAGPGPEPDRQAGRGRDPPAARSGRSSGSRAAPRAAATARSSRWRTSTST